MRRVKAFREPPKDTKRNQADRPLTFTNPANDLHAVEECQPAMDLTNGVLDEHAMLDHSEPERFDDSKFDQVFGNSDYYWDLFLSDVDNRLDVFDE